MWRQMNNELKKELERIARLSIKKNWCQPHKFSKTEIKPINRRCDSAFDAGYCILDQPYLFSDDPLEGTIQLTKGELIFKWIFWLDEEEIMLEGA